MLRFRPLTVTLCAVAISACGLLAAFGPGVATAKAADVVVPFNNWKVTGTLRLHRIHQTIAFPSGATFNGAADLTTGTLGGNVFVPPFTSTIRVFGIPTKVSQRLQQATAVAGAVTVGAGGNVTINASTSDIINLTSVGLGPFTIPTTCHTSAPVVFDLNYSGPLTLNTGFTFTGSTTIPSLTGCGLLGPALSLLLAGPGNTYSLSIAPPPAG